MKQETKQYKLNVPTDLHQWIEGEAAISCRSKSGLIIFILREKMQAAAGGEFGDRTPTAASRTDALPGVNSTNG